MSNYIVKDTELTSVANAIRIKGGTNSQLVFPGGFVSAIGNISGGETWQTVFEGSVTTVMSVDFALADITDLESLSGDSIKVTFNGTEYILPKVADGYGAMTQDEMPDFSEYPLFIVTLEQPYTIYTETAGTYTLKIEEPQSGGSSDFSTAVVTVDSGAAIQAPVIANEEEFQGIVLIEDPMDEQKTWHVPLYKGKCLVCIYTSDVGQTITVSGNITKVDTNLYLITGDGTITIS